MARRGLALFAVAAAAALLPLSPAVAAPPAPAKPPAKPAPAQYLAQYLAPPPPLAMLPSIARVTLTTHGASVVVTHDVNLPRGEWKGEALHFHVAFGAPGPRAIDARLVPVADGALEADADAAGEVVPSDRVPRRPGNAHTLLGRDAMAGIVVHLKPDALTRAFAPGNMATLRIRAVSDATEADASGASSIVVRLGVSRGVPLTLGRIVGSADGPAPLARVEARLCGPDADPQPLAVGILARGVLTRPASGVGTTIAPVLAVRHASDDLCVRFWTRETRDDAPPKSS